MRDTSTRRSPRPADVSLEEVLQRAQARFALLADLFTLQAVAPGYAQTEALSSAACDALAALCRDGRHELQATLAALPGTTLNWIPRRAVTPAGSRPVGKAAGSGLARSRRRPRRRPGR